MWIYEKKLQHPIRIKNTNPALAQVILDQYGGADCKSLSKLKSHKINIFKNQKIQIALIF